MMINDELLKLGVRNVAQIQIRKILTTYSLQISKYKPVMVPNFVLISNRCNTVPVEYKGTIIFRIH
jgi:hypothetical protein